MLQAVSRYQCQGTKYTFDIDTTHHHPALLSNVNLSKLNRNSNLAWDRRQWHAEVGRDCQDVTRLYNSSIS